MTPCQKKLTGTLHVHPQGCHTKAVISEWLKYFKVSSLIIQQKAINNIKAPRPSSLVCPTHHTHHFNSSWASADLSQRLQLNKSVINSYCGLLSNTMLKSKLVINRSYQFILWSTLRLHMSGIFSWYNSSTVPNLTTKIFTKSKKNKQKTNEESLFLHRDLKSKLFEGLSMKVTNQHNTAALKKFYQNRATT